MALDVASGTFLCPGSTGVTQVVSGLSFQPKVVILWGCGQNTSSGRTDDNRGFIGAADGTRDRSISANDEHGVTTTDAHRRWSSSNCVNLHTTGGSGMTMQGSLDSLDSDGFSINFSSVSSGKIIGYLCLGGSDVENVEVNSFSLDSGVTGTQDITFSTAFQPDGVILLGPQTDVATETNANDAHFSMGFADFTNQYCLSSTSENGVGTSDCSHTQTNDSCIIRQEAGSTSIVGEANMDSALSNGFRIDITDDFSGSFVVPYIAFKGPKIHVGETAFRTTLGTIVETGVGFQPKALFGMNQNNDLYSGTGHYIMTVGATDGTDENCMCVTSDNDETTTDTASRADTSNFMIDSDFNNNVDGIASFVSFDEDGFTLDQSGNASNDPVVIPYMAFGSKSGLQKKTLLDAMGGLYQNPDMVGGMQG